MSKTAPAAFHGIEFWIYDVAKSILLAEMVAVADEVPHTEWLEAIVPELRVDAIVGSDHFMPLDEWSAGHEPEFLALVEKATERLGKRRQVTAAEAAEWFVIDGQTIIWRGDDVISTEPIVALGKAILAMARGEYPAAPRGQRWYFGWPGEVRTIRSGD